MPDAAYAHLPYRGAELDHAYGPAVHLAADPVLLALLAKACAPDCRQPHLGRLVEVLFVALAQWASAAELPRRRLSVATRMRATTPAGVWEGEVVDPSTPVVTVALARAGTVASQAVFAFFCELLDARGVRQDHIFMNRATDAAGRVEGVVVGGQKLGGPAAGAHVWVPDPMAATGSSMRFTVDLYRGLAGGPPARLVALHLVVTPEYLAAMREHCPEVAIYALRLDRGLSPASVLARPLGERPADERGLDDHQYIVPGAGGMGEVLNHTDA